MRDLVNAGAVELIEATVAAGASPAAARKWWSGELARRANLDGVELGELPVTPAQVAGLQALVDAGKVNDALARQVLDGVLAGEGDPEQVVAARGLAVVSDDGALGEARGPGDRGEPGRRRQDPRRQGGRGRGADRRGDEGDARAGRRGQGPRDHHRPARAGGVTPRSL